MVVTEYINQFPLDKEIPFELIKKVVQFLKQND